MKTPKESLPELGNAQIEAVFAGVELPFSDWNNWTTDRLTDAAKQIFAAGVKAGIEMGTKEAVTGERARCAEIAKNFVWYEEEGCGPDDQNAFIAVAILEKKPDEK